MKVIEEVYSNEKLIGYWAKCPGCGFGHVLYTNYADHPNWSFDGNMEKPTFSPSLLVNGPEQAKVKRRCHSFIRNGQWQFLNDCTHELKGKTVDMLPVGNDDED